MKHYGIALALLALTGCETCKKHEVACAIVAGCIALSVGLIHHGHKGSSGTEPRMSIPLVPDCAIYPELCK